MRKTITLSLVAGAALLVAACNKTEAPVAADNTAAPEVNASDAMEGTTNDAMTNTDAAAAGAEANMSADANAAAGNAAEAATNAVAENAAK